MTQIGSIGLPTSQHETIFFIGEGVCSLVMVVVVVVVRDREVMPIVSKPFAMRHETCRWIFLKKKSIHTRRYEHRHQFSLVRLFVLRGTFSRSAAQSARKVKRVNRQTYFSRVHGLPPEFRAD